MCTIDKNDLEINYDYAWIHFRKTQWKIYFRKLLSYQKLPEWNPAIYVFKDHDIFLKSENEIDGIEVILATEMNLFVEDFDNMMGNFY